MSFPDTKYMGSKQAILPFIRKEMETVEFDTVLDAFSGSGCVAYELKKLRKRVIANDFLRFAYCIAHAVIENNSVGLSPEDVKELLSINRKCPTFIQEKFAGLYFDEEDCGFLDNTWANIQRMRSPYRKSLALAALCRACQKKRPRGLFTFVGKKGWDNRRDLKLSMQEQFVQAVQLFNDCVFTNKRDNKALCLDVFETPVQGIDLVYIDPPYISRHSDCDYTRRYHFIEGLCTYWQGVKIQEHTLTKKIESRPTAFASPATARESFCALFDHFRSCKIALSYGSNGIPSCQDMVALLKMFKRKVRVSSVSHKYCVANQRHKVGDNKNDVLEYLFIAT